MIMEGRELIITSLNKTDNGTYRCEAKNHLGTNSDEYVLFVYGEFFFLLIMVAYSIVAKKMDSFYMFVFHTFSYVLYVSFQPFAV